MWLLIAGVILGVGVGFIVRDRTRVAQKVTPAVVTEDAPVIDSEAEIRILLDALPMGIVVLLADGQERFRNTVATSIAGARHADVLVEVAAERLLVLALRGLESREQIQLAGPPQRVLEVRAIPLADGGAVAIMDDVTERWRIDQVRTDFVANVSHELKTPVGAISVLAETIEGETDDELVLRLTGRMVIEAQRMSRTIDDLLELSRIELGGEMLKTDVDMADVVAESIERVAPIAMRKGVPLMVKSEKGVAIISGDFFQLVSAIANLVENAVKYSDETHQVDVRVVTSDTTVSVEVEDRGIGIPADSVDRIFERFYRVDRARNRATGGTGLGLSIVRHVATNHGGEVNVRSREGEGSTFILQIPRVLRSV
ncbi:MAG: two-component sensor histidine kinase [Actinobacteria bacterium]|uniref:histidine kinase n=1 Tax=freshwater metagenome TaxID=449393 RepID=A0A6J7T2K7_9ZZZZ|nr:two-component sensor histidine kinase [Actinomycetota bacterium]